MLGKFVFAEVFFKGPRYGKWSRGNLVMPLAGLGTAYTPGSITPLLPTWISSISVKCQGCCFISWKKWQFCMNIYIYTYEYEDTVNHKLTPTIIYPAQLFISLSCFCSETKAASLWRLNQLLIPFTMLVSHPQRLNDLLTLGGSPKPFPAGRKMPKCRIRLSFRYFPMPFVSIK